MQRPELANVLSQAHHWKDALSVQITTRTVGHKTLHFLLVLQYFICNSCPRCGTAYGRAY
jgi:hypothetical protein